jgi:hypothetical protein
MTRLAMRGMRSMTGMSRTDEDRSTTRRWARAMCMIDFIVFAAVLIGVSLYDLRANQVADHVRTIGADAPADLQTTAGIRKGSQLQ